MCGFRISGNRYDVSDCYQLWNGSRCHSDLPVLVLAVTWGASGEARQIGLTFAVFMLFIGFFSHNVLDERYCLMMFSLMAAMVVSSKMKAAADTCKQII